MRPVSRLFFSHAMFLFALANLSSLEPAWKRVLSGKISASPVAFRDRLYVETTDRAITCLSVDGSFLWSRPLPGKSTPFLTVTDQGMVLAVSGTGTITACNRDGSFLWQLSGRDLPILAPKTGRDGRIFLVYRKRILCISPTGGVKWTLPIDDDPLDFISETGEGELLLPCAGKVLLRISPFGELREKIGCAGEIRSLRPIPSGFAAGFEDGTVLAFDVRNGRTARGRADSEVVWEYRGRSPAIALAYADSSILVLDGDGLIVSLNGTDGSFLWSLSTGMIPGNRASILFDYGQLNVSCGAGVMAIDPQGPLLWKYDLPVGAFLPRFAADGTVYTADSDEIVRAWKIESRINSEKKTQKSINYGILNGKSSGYGMPGGPDRRSVASFLDAVNTEISDGTVGSAEIHYARKLSEILRGDSGEGPWGLQYDESEKARAATLLGKLGSAEYRPALLAEAETVCDPTFATGILLGIAAFGFDPDGLSLDAVEKISKRCGAFDRNVNFASCDALYAIIRYSSGSTAKRGTALLASFLDGGSDAAVSEYARRTLEKLLK